MKTLTICLSYYNQPLKCIKKHLEYWKTYDLKYKEQINFLIVDDGSKIPLSEIISKSDIEKLDVQIYRVEVDLFCNIAGVRNLSAQECQTKWMLIIDMDTLVPKEMIVQLFDIISSNPQHMCYKFNRKVANDPKHPKHERRHPAVCLIAKEDYWDIGGCEEDLVGHYGGTDPSFFYKGKDKIKIDVRMDIYLDYYPDGEADIKRNKNRNWKLIEQRKKTGKWSTDYVRFKWHKVDLI